MSDGDADFPDPSPWYGLTLDGDGVVVAAVRSNCAQPGTTAVDGPTYEAARGRVGLCKLVGGALQDYAPPPQPAPPPTVTGNQWTFALKDLGLGSAWRVARAKSKPDDQSRIELIARDTPLLASDPLLIRVAANAGTVDGTAGGAPSIDVPAVFAHAQGMPR